jgi:hypothetical protein
MLSLSTFGGTFSKNNSSILVEACKGFANSSVNDNNGQYNFVNASWCMQFGLLFMSKNKTFKVHELLTNACSPGKFVEKNNRYEAASWCYFRGLKKAYEITMNQKYYDIVEVCESDDLNMSDDLYHCFQDQLLRL